MNRFSALLKETWWLWVTFFIAGLGLSLLSPVFLTTFFFYWFAYIRFGDDGEFKGS